MADLTASVPSHVGPSRTSSGGRAERQDMVGIGKFKLAAASTKGSKYKDKFHHQREKYDTATSRQEDLRKELEIANAKLRKLQAENDLLLDAMQIVVPSQPGLQEILRQISPQIETPHGLNGHGHTRAHEHTNGDMIEHDTHADYPQAHETNGR